MANPTGHVDSGNGISPELPSRHPQPPNYYSNSLAAAAIRQLATSSIAAAPPSWKNFPTRHRKSIPEKYSPSDDHSKSAARGWIEALMRRQYLIKLSEKPPFFATISPELLSSQEPDPSEGIFDAFVTIFGRFPHRQKAFRRRTNLTVIVSPWRTQPAVWIQTISTPKTFAEALSSPIILQQTQQNCSELEKFFTAESKIPSFGSQALINGRPTLAFTDSETEILTAPFRFALIGKFSHGTPQYRNLHRLLAGLGLKGKFTMSMLNAKHAIITLSNESDFTKLWTQRIWHIHGFSMRIFKWCPTFTPEKESPVVPIWVCFPNLSAHLYHKNALFCNCQIWLAPPLQIDDYTFNLSKLSKARICVEIDLLELRIQEFDIVIQGLTINQKVEYEQIPHYCSLCKHVGYNDGDCYSKRNAPKPRRQENFQKGKKQRAKAQNVAEFGGKNVARHSHGDEIETDEIGRAAQWESYE
ncbi:hypothetical protein Sango_2502600 [Sesamum angolense]|uniref:DUF4283 domain-containing protein n=1 Tax=Sesamum angolense TaxID=2727404 RepID=A0AAE1W3X4_9LAMI|nr:hypothetical protein Sango_2502600 [Sesamum angolense]